MKENFSKKKLLVFFFAEYQYLFLMQVIIAGKHLQVYICMCIVPNVKCKEVRWHLDFVFAARWRNIYNHLDLSLWIMLFLLFTILLLNCNFVVKNRHSVIKTKPLTMLSIGRVACHKLLCECGLILIRLTGIRHT